MKQRCQSSRFLSRQGLTAFGGQNIENPVDIKVPKVSSQDRMLQRTVEQTLDESRVAREPVQQRTAKSDKYGQELDALFRKQRAFEDHSATFEREAEYNESVAEKERLDLMPLLRNSLFQNQGTVGSRFETSVSAKLPKFRNGEIQLLPDSVSNVEHHSVMHASWNVFPFFLCVLFSRRRMFPWTLVQ